MLVMAIVATVVLIYQFWAFIFPISTAFFISFLIQPPVNFLIEKARLPRPLAVALILSGTFLFFLGMLFLIITEIAQGTAFLADKIPSYYHNFILFLEQFFNRNVLPLYDRMMSFFYSLEPEYQLTIHEYVRSLSDQAASTGADFLKNSLSNLPAVIAVVPGSLTIFVFIVLAVFLISIDWENIVRVAEKFISPKAGASFSEVFGHFRKSIGGFLKAQLTLIAISALLAIAGLLILGVEHAITIALLMAAVDLIPYLGTGLIFIPWIIYLYAMADYKLTIGLCVLYIVIILTRQILEPKIMSSSIGIHPLIILFGVFGAIQFLGVAGLLVAPLLIVVGNALYQAGIFRRLWDFVKG